MLTPQKMLPQVPQAKIIKTYDNELAFTSFR